MTLSTLTLFQLFWNLILLIFSPHILSVLGLIPHTKTTIKALTIYFSLLLPSKLLNSFFFMTRFTNIVILLNTSFFPLPTTSQHLERQTFYSLLVVKLLSWWLPKILFFQDELDLSKNLSLKVLLLSHATQMIIAILWVGWAIRDAGWWRGSYLEHCKLLWQKKREFYKVLQ